MLCTVLVLGWLWMLPAPYAALSRDVAASAAFAANIALLLQSGYFDIESAKKPLLHLWSLGIEEQFYLFWPLILMLAARQRWSLRWVAVAIAVASFVLNVALIGSDPVATFYLPFTRAWELLAGAVLACAWNRIDQSEAASNRRAVAGVVLIVAAAAMLNVHRAFPGWWALLPVAGSALLLSAPASWINRARAELAADGVDRPDQLSALSLALAAAGDVRDHQVRAADPHRARIDRACQRAARLGHLLGSSSGRSASAVPMPMQGWRRSPAQWRWWRLRASIVFEGRGFDFRLPGEIRAMAEVPAQSAQWRVHQCLLDLSHETGFADDCVDRDRRPLLLRLGRFHRGGADAGPAQGAAEPRFRYRAVDREFLHPGPQRRYRRARRTAAPINDQVLALARQIQPDIVLLHGTWEKYLDHARRDRDRAEAADRRARRRARVRCRAGQRGLPNEVLRYYLLHQA